jgi:hypothetical protein
MLTGDAVEYYAGVCQQCVHQIHGIVILQGPRPAPSYENNFRMVPDRDVMNVSPLQKTSIAACFYMQRQLVNSLRGFTTLLLT